MRHITASTSSPPAEEAVAYALSLNRDLRSLLALGDGRLHFGGNARDLAARRRKGRITRAQHLAALDLRIPERGRLLSQGGGLVRMSWQPKRGTGRAICEAVTARRQRFVCSTVRLDGLRGARSSLLHVCCRVRADCEGVLQHGRHTARGVAGACKLLLKRVVALLGVVCATLQRLDGELKLGELRRAGDEQLLQRLALLVAARVPVGGGEGVAADAAARSRAAAARGG